MRYHEPVLLKEALQELKVEKGNSLFLPYLVKFKMQITFVSKTISLITSFFEYSNKLLFGEKAYNLIPRHLIFVNFANCLFFL